MYWAYHQMGEHSFGLGLCQVYLPKQVQRKANEPYHCGHLEPKRLSVLPKSEALS